MPADYLKPSCCFSFMSYKPPKKAMTVFVDPMRIIVWAVSLSVGVSGYRLRSCHNGHTPHKTQLERPHLFTASSETT